MARKPKPSHLHVVEGTARVDRHDFADEPKQPPGTPRLPVHLSPHAKDAWRKLAPLLASMGVLTVADAMALERLCECYAEVRTLQKAISDAGGPFYQTKTDKGDTMHRVRPEQTTLQNADMRLKAYLAEFGLTPSARTRVKVAGEGGAKDDPLNKYFG